MKPTGVLSGFRRSSLADQATVALRSAIQRGLLGDPLPAERLLALDMGISRPSLRLAMAHLAEEGLIVCSNGRRARLASRGKGPARNNSLTVHVVCPISREVLIYNQHPLLLEMHAYFASKGIAWEYTFDAKLNAPHPERHLQALISRSKRVCWILFDCPPPIQRWFAQSGQPVLVLGTTFAGVNLPSTDLDYRAVGWHAAGTIAKMGHKHVALLQPHRLQGGDIESCEGFRSYFTKNLPEVVITPVHVTSVQPGLNGKLSKLAAARHRPTAIFSLLPEYTLAAMVTLPRLGLRIPTDISLVSRDTTPLIDAALPEITRYRTTSFILAGRAERLSQAILSGQYVAAKPSLVTPAFTPGLTLAPPPAHP